MRSFKGLHKVILGSVLGWAQGSRFLQLRSYELGCASMCVSKDFVERFYGF